MQQNKLIKTQAYFDELNRVIEQCEGKRKELAKRLEVTLSTISNWFSCSSRHWPSAENAYVMQKFFNANPEILRGKNDKKLIVIEY